jgi:hypothetical protein
MSVGGIAVLSKPKRYVPYNEAAGAPNIVVDGATNDNCKLILSHWPKSGTPWPLKADTSAEIVFKYLDDGAWHSDVPVVTNDHFDEDGLISVYSLVNPAHALEQRELLADAARAGDFGTYRLRDAVRLAFAISRLGNPALSPWGSSAFPEDYSAFCAFAYGRLLGQLGDLIERIDSHRDLWGDEDGLLEASERAVDSGEITIEEDDDADLAVVRIPADWPERPPQRYASVLNTPVHRMAIHNRTRRNRIAVLCGTAIHFTYRYESWVQMTSDRPNPRVDLATLAAALSEADGAPWTFDGVQSITPSLYPASKRSNMSHERFIAALARALQHGQPAWDPYDAMVQPPSGGEHGLGGSTTRLDSAAK